MANSGIARAGTIKLTAGTATVTLNVTQQGAAPALTLSATAWNPTKPTKATTRVQVTTNLGRWTVSTSDASWLTTSAASGSTRANVTVTAQKNNSPAARTAYLTFTAGALTARYTVTQPAGVSVTVTPATGVLAKRASSAAFRVRTNGLPWTASSDQPWLTLSKASGGNGASFTARATANTGPARRATVTAISDGTIFQVVITQLG
jgi:hypothetical protein